MFHSTPKKLINQLEILHAQINANYARGRILQRKVSQNKTETLNASGK